MLQWRMKQFLNIFFVVMGVVFTVLIIIGAYLFISDPWNIRPMLEGSTGGNTVTKPQPKNEAPVTTTSIGTTTSNEIRAPQETSVTESTSFTLSEEQKQALTSFGVDPSTIPSTISPEVEACFVANLGAPRVAEIKAGAVPGALEFFKAKSCI